MQVRTNNPPAIELRPMVPADLPTLFQFNCDPQSCWTAAFTSKDHTNRDAYLAKWERLLKDPTITARTILMANTIVGSIGSWLRDGRPELTYWIAREHWNKGIATEALRQFLQEVTARPIHASCVKDNTGSLRVLEKCGFKVFAEETGFANARNAEVQELRLRLD